MEEILFIFLIAAWLLEWLVYVDTANKRKEGYIKAILIKFIIFVASTFSIFVSLFLRATLGEPMSFTISTGLISIALGLLLRYWTYYMTKPFFTRTINPLEERPLFSNGPYRFTRHPFHTGYFLIVLGICLFISGHWLVVFTTFLFVGSALHYPMTLEETIYYEKYGDIYLYWCKHRFRLLPFIY